MRLFRKKSDPPGHQEYLDGLITSIRQARKEEEEKGLHAFVEEDNFPVAEEPGPPRVPPGVAKATGTQPGAEQGEEAEEIANLEAYLSQLEAADQSPEEEGEEGEENAANF
jgi:hypothetical protein